MLYSEIIAVCSQIHTKHINTVCGQDVELLNDKLAVHIVTNGLSMNKSDRLMLARQPTLSTKDGRGKLCGRPWRR